MTRAVFMVGIQYWEFTWSLLHCYEHAKDVVFKIKGLLFYEGSNLELRQ